MKKGKLTLVTIFEILAAFIVTSVLITVMYSYGSSDLIKTTSIADELSSMVNTLVSLPGDAQVRFPKNVSDYEIVLDNKKINLINKESDKLNKISKGFILPKDYVAFGKTKNKEQICLEKKNKNILLKEC